MSSRLVITLAAVAALAMAVPATANFTGVCNPDPYICAGVDQREGDYHWAFLIVETDFAGAFAGREERTSTGYSATGACGGALVTGGCAVLFQDGEDLYLMHDVGSECTTVPLNGGTEDFC